MSNVAWTTPAPSNHTNADIDNYFVWTTAVYAILTAAAVLLGVAACVVVLNRVYWRPRRLRAAVEAQNHLRGQGGWFEYASTSSVEPRPLTSIPVLIEHPDGCVEVALQPVVAKVEGERAECPPAGREVEMAAVASASARSPLRNRSGGLRSVADSSGGAAPFSDVDLERGLSIIASLATPRVIWARHAAYLESRRAAQIPFMTAVIGPDGLEYVSELGVPEAASAPATDENEAKEGVEVAELPEESPAPGPSRSSVGRQRASVGSESGLDAGG